MSKEDLTKTTATAARKKDETEGKQVPDLKEEDPIRRRLCGKNLNLWLWSNKEEKTEDAGHRLLELIESAKTIESVDVGADLWKHLSSEEVTKVLQAVAELPNLKWLHLSLGCFSPSKRDERCSLSTKTLAHVASKARKLQYLILKDVDLEGSTVEWNDFAESLRSHSSLVHFRLENYALPDSSIDLGDLVTALSCVSTLQMIEIFATEGSSKSQACHVPVSALECLVRDTKSLQVIRFSGLDIGDDHLSKIVESISNNDILKELVLWNAQITEKGSSGLAKALKANASIEKLNLNDNASMGSRGCLNILEAVIGSAPSLQELYVGCSHMSAECREALLRLIERNTGKGGPNLQRLEICFSWPLDTTVQSLAEFEAKLENALRQPRQALKSLRLYHDERNGEGLDLHYGAKWEKRPLEDDDNSDDKEECR